MSDYQPDCDFGVAIEEEVEQLKKEVDKLKQAREEEKKEQEEEQEKEEKRNWQMKKVFLTALATSLLTGAVGVVVGILGF